MQIKKEIEYSTFELMNILGELINKSQRIRNALPVNMKTGDVRQVCLSGIQTLMEYHIVSFAALEFVKQSIPSLRLEALTGLKARSNNEIIQNFDVNTKINLLTFSHFKFENFFFHLNRVFDRQYCKKKFDQIFSDLLKNLSVNQKDEKKDLIKAFTSLRNSQHNNSIHRHRSFDVVINGKKFSFTEGNPTESTLFDIIFLIDLMLDTVEEICFSEEILTISEIILDDFHSKHLKSY